MPDTNHQSLEAKYATRDVLKQYEGVRTQSGATFADVIRSGVENPDSSVGAYAPDTESYDLFDSFFRPLIAEYHNVPEGAKHRTDLDTSHLRLTDLDPEGAYIVSTRIRVARNFIKYAFQPTIGLKQRLQLLKEAGDALLSLEGDLAGELFPLEGMDEETRKQLVADHFLFKRPDDDKYLVSAGIERDWPQGRAIYFAKDKKFLVWIGEEDHLRIISMEQGGDIRSVFSRLSRALEAINAKLEFAHHEQYGYLASCPTNIGTGMRASVHVKLEHLDEARIKEIATRLNLSVRGIHGEHSASEGGVYDISNKRRLGLSEVQAVQDMHDGVRELIALDKAAQAAK